MVFDFHVQDMTDTICVTAYESEVAKFCPKIRVNGVYKICDGQVQCANCTERLGVVEKFVRNSERENKEGKEKKTFEEKNKLRSKRQIDNIFE